jgi:hypothetical protein
MLRLPYGYRKCRPSRRRRRFVRRKPNTIRRLYLGPWCAGDGLKTSGLRAAWRRIFACTPMIRTSSSIGSTFRAGAARSRRSLKSAPNPMRAAVSRDPAGRIA